MVSPTLPKKERLITTMSLLRRMGLPSSLMPCAKFTLTWRFVTEPLGFNRIKSTVVLLALESLNPPAANIA
jgi:hypothetical protein